MVDRGMIVIKIDDTRTGAKGRIVTYPRGRITWICQECDDSDDLARGWGEAVDAFLAHYETEHS
jgi:hypothetical protein